MTSATPPSGKSTGVVALVRSGAIFPAILIACVATGVIGMVAYIAGNAVRNHSLMPQPTPLTRYDCQGFPVALSVDFRHGKDAVRLHANAIELNGEILNGKIVWSGFAAATQTLGFAPPTELVYDDARSVHLLDTQGAEHTCARPG